MNLRGRWKITATYNKVIAISTAFAAAGTLAYAIFAAQQLTEIRKSSADTHDLADAAKKQADSARAQSDQAKLQTGDMAQSLTKTDSLVKATSDLARAAELQSKTLDRLDNLQVQIARIQVGTANVNLTPWLGFFRIGDQVYATVAVDNTGPRAATDIQIAARLEFRQKPPTNYAVGEFSRVNLNELPPFNQQSPRFTGSTGPDDHRKFLEYALSQDIKLPIRMPISDYARYRNETLYIWGQIRFKDFTGDWAPLVKFCREIKAANLFDAREGRDGGTSSSIDCN